MKRRQGGSSDHDLKACSMARNELVAGLEAAEKEVAGRRGHFGRAETLDAENLKSRSSREAGIWRIGEIREGNSFDMSDNLAAGCCPSPRKNSLSPRLWQLGL
jgi:hypothetical protein